MIFPAYWRHHIYTSRSDSSKQRFKFKIWFAHAKKENDGSIIDRNQLSAVVTCYDRRRQTREQEPFALALGKELGEGGSRQPSYTGRAGRRRPAELFSSILILVAIEMPELDVKAVSITLYIKLSTCSCTCHYIRHLQSLRLESPSPSPATASPPLQEP
jgi:hypothetical protein